MQLRDKNCGILLALSSLPSNYGIGSLGEEAYKFIDLLKECKQTYWQLLPLCPLGKGNSPYSSYSTFAGEILYIDFDILIAEGYLQKEDIPKRTFKKNTDYNAVKNFKIPILKNVAKNFKKEEPLFLKFKKDNDWWLSDYCLFMAISEQFSNKNFTRWDDNFKYRNEKILKEFKEQNREKIDFYEITQFLFYKQFNNLSRYAKKNGIKLMGDIPFYVSLESCDVWTNPKLFKLGTDYTPTFIAGVPPDLFSENGQLWSNPIYNWTEHKKQNFLWWKKRLSFEAELYDAVRIDHFRAFNDYYSVPYGAKNAKEGEWEKGPNMAFWNEVKPVLQDTEIIAEDLGLESPDVQKLIKDTGFPNMKVLQFAFDSDLKDPFLPKNMNKNCVCYTGTHDNDTTLGWYKTATENEKNLYHKLVPNVFDSVPLNLILFGMKSRAKTVIIPLQDYLELGSEGRLNTPGKALFNWEWRFQKKDITPNLKEKILKLSKNRYKKA